MSFYVIPPTSSGRLEQLILDVKNRLKLLYLLVQCNKCATSMKQHLQESAFALGSDGLIEHTSRDKDSHFLLRTAASADLFFQKFFLQSEVLLLEYRLECSQGSLHFSISKLLAELLQSRTELSALSDHGAALSVAKDVLQFACIDKDARCGKCSVKVAWEQVPGLVAARAVAVQHGVCSIPCADVTQLLSELFQRLLSAGVHDMRRCSQMYRLELGHAALHDSLKKIVSSFMSSHHLTSSNLTPQKPRVAPLKAGEILRASRLFPPCMAQLQQLLTKHRRLPHHQRYRYSVFLKSIGVPLQENILFWQGHYTAAAHEHSACDHHWARDGGRYVYSLRHLYGLEGRRRAAAPHSCHQLQSMSAQPSDCGGCPFAVVASTASRSSELPGAAAAAQASESNDPWSNLKRGGATNFTLPPHPVMCGACGKSGRGPTDNLTRKLTEMRNESQNGKDLPKICVHPLSGMASSSLTPRRSKNQVNTKAKKLMRCDSFSMNDQIEAGLHRQSTLIEVPSRHFSCEECKPSASTVTSIGLEYGLQFRDKLKVPLAAKLSSETSTYSSVESETLLASNRVGLGTGLFLEKQLISEKETSFSHCEQGSCSIRNVGESKASSSALQSRSPLLHSQLIMRPISSLGTSHPISLSSSYQKYSHRVSSIKSSTPRLACVSSFKSVALSPRESCATSMSWSTVWRPIPSSFSFSKTRQPLSSESATLSPQSSSLDRVLLACGVRCSNVRWNIIRVACDGHASLACRLTLAVLLDQAETGEVVTSTNEENEKISHENVSSESNEEKFIAGVKSVKVPLGGGLATCCNTDRTVTDVPSSQKKNDCEKISCRSSDFAKRKYDPSDFEEALLDSRKKLNRGLVTNSFLFDQTSERGRIHNTNDLKNTFSCCATKTCSSISNCSSNLKHSRTSATSNESKFKEICVHRSLCEEVSPLRKISDCVENIHVTDLEGSDNISVPLIQTSCLPGSRKSISQNVHSNSSGNDELGENNSRLLSGSPPQINSHYCAENVSQQSVFTHDEDISVIWMNLNKSSSKSCFPSLGSLKSWPEDGERQGTALADSAELNSVRSTSPDMFASSQSCSARFDSAAFESNIRSHFVPSRENSVPKADVRVTYEENGQNLKVSNSMDGGGAEDHESRASGVVTNLSSCTSMRNSVTKQKGSSQFGRYKPDISSPINNSFTAQSIDSKNTSKVSRIVLNPRNLSTAEINQIVKSSERKPLVNLQSKRLKKGDYSGSTEALSEDKIRKLLCRTRSFFEPAQEINVAFGLEKQRNSFDSKPTSKKSKRSTLCAGRTTAPHASENNLPYPDGSGNRKLPRLETQACVAFGSELNGHALSPVNGNPGGILSASLPSVVKESTNASSSFLDMKKNSIPFEILESKNMGIPSSASSSTRENINLRPNMFSTNNRSYEGVAPLSERKTAVNAELVTEVTKSLVSINVENVSFSKSRISSKCVMYGDSSPKPEVNNKSSVQSISSSKFINQNSSSGPKQESCENFDISSIPALGGHSETTDKLDPCASDMDALKDPADVPLVTGTWMRRALNPVDVGLNFTAPHQYYQLLSER